MDYHASPVQHRMGIKYIHHIQYIQHILLGDPVSTYKGFEPFFYNQQSGQCCQLSFMFRHKMWCRKATAWLKLWCLWFQSVYYPFPRKKNLTAQPSHIQPQNVILKSDAIVEASGSLADSWNSVLRPKWFRFRSKLYQRNTVLQGWQKVVQYFVA